MDKSKADFLKAKGFKYIKRVIDDNEAYVFLQTNELTKELNSSFDEGSFFVSKNVCF